MHSERITPELLKQACENGWVNMAYAYLYEVSLKGDSRQKVLDWIKQIQDPDVRLDMLVMTASKGKFVHLFQDTLQGKNITVEVLCDLCEILYKSKEVPIHFSLLKEIFNYVDRTYPEGLEQYQASNSDCEFIHFMDSFVDNVVIRGGQVLEKPVLRNISKETSGSFSDEVTNDLSTSQGSVSSSLFSSKNIKNSLLSFDHRGYKQLNDVVKKIPTIRMLLNEACEFLDEGAPTIYINIYLYNLSQCYRFIPKNKMALDKLCDNLQLFPINEKLLKLIARYSLVSDYEGDRVEELADCLKNMLGTFPTTADENTKIELFNQAYSELARRVEEQDIDAKEILSTLLSYLVGFSKDPKFAENYAEVFALLNRLNYENIFQQLDAINGYKDKILANKFPNKDKTLKSQNDTTNSDARFEVLFKLIEANCKEGRMALSSKDYAQAREQYSSAIRNARECLYLPDTTNEEYQNLLDDFLGIKMIYADVCMLDPAFNNKNLFRIFAEIREEAEGLTDPLKKKECISRAWVAEAKIHLNAAKTKIPSKKIKLLTEAVSKYENVIDIYNTIPNYLKADRVWKFLADCYESLSSINHQLYQISNGNYFFVKATEFKSLQARCLESLKGGDESDKKKAMQIDIELFKTHRAAYDAVWTEIQTNHYYQINLQFQFHYYAALLSNFCVSFYKLITFLNKQSHPLTVKLKAVKSKLELLPFGVFQSQLVPKTRKLCEYLLENPISAAQDITDNMLNTLYAHLEGLDNSIISLNDNFLEEFCHYTLLWKRNASFLDEEGYVVTQKYVLSILINIMAKIPETKRMFMNQTYGIPVILFQAFINHSANEKPIESIFEELKPFWGLIQKGIHAFIAKMPPVANSSQILLANEKEQSESNTPPDGCHPDRVSKPGSIGPTELMQGHRLV